MNIDRQTDTALASEQIKKTIEASGVQPVLSLSYKRGRTYVTSNTVHEHNEYELYYLVAGTKTFHVRDRVYNLKPGDLMIVPPNSPHRSVWKELGVPSNRIVLIFNEAFIGPVRELAHSEHINALLSDTDQLIHITPAGRFTFDLLMKHLNDEISSDKTEYLSMCRTYVLQLCVCMLRTGGFCGYDKRKTNRSCIEDILSYIDSNYHKDLSFRELASAFYMNPSAMARSFKAKTGMTVISYINHKRVEKAKELLVQQAASVKGISDSLRFNSTTYFERVFKQQTGITPTEYRKRASPGL